MAGLGGLAGVLLLSQILSVLVIIVMAVTMKRYTNILILLFTYCAIDCTGVNIITSKIGPL